ncbi:MAG TPA: class I SAM-dependent methyltransferase [Armatimonadota bacterium]|nr:class I SAM-dependent methyltransferase [Armatimonadota bacterium]
MRTFHILYCEDMREWEIERGTDDINLIQRLIGDRGPLRILEPFCGTGRILIPLAQDGHEIVGLDKSRFMLDRTRTKVAQLPEDIQQRIKLIEADATVDEWPNESDVVILGGNWPYELPAPEVQEGCIASAAASLKPGGHIFHDSDHMEGALDPRWREAGNTLGCTSANIAYHVRQIRRRYEEWVE